MTSNRFTLANEAYKAGWKDGYKEGERAGLQVAEMFCEDESLKRQIQEKLEVIQS